MTGTAQQDSLPFTTPTMGAMVGRVSMWKSSRVHSSLFGSMVVTPSVETAPTFHAPRAGVCAVPHV